MNRRGFMLMAASGCVLSSVCPELRAVENSPEGQSTPPQGDAAQRTAEEWMNAWMNSPQRGEEGTLFLGRFVEPIYFLTKPITWKPNPEQKGYQPVTAPVGFVTDLASIPRPFWSFLRPDGGYVYSAILHDYMYWTQTRSRETADTIFKLGMQDFDVKPTIIDTIFRAVRLGGGSAWEDNQKQKRAGEKRFLRVFPEDPRTRWADYKKRPGVFSDE